MVATKTDFPLIIIFDNFLVCFLFNQMKNAHNNLKVYRLLVLFQKIIRKRPKN